MQSMWLYLFVLILVPYLAQAHQPAELFNTFEAFLTRTIDHTTGEHVSVFSPNCIGRINAMTILKGADNNTEFIYGIPAALAKANSTQLIGYPTNVVVEALALQLSVVSATALFSMYYATVSQVVPLQVDMWLHFNEDLQIDAYDFMPRRLDRFLASAALMLSGQISLEIPLDDTYNATSIISQKVAEDVCMAALEYCSGNNQQYDSKISCVESSSSWDTDTNICRYMFKNMVQAQPNAYCASLGPNGGNCGKACRGRSQICPNECLAVQAYAEATVEYPFVPSLFAPNVSMLSTAGLSDKTFEELMKINMAIVYPTTVAFYPIPAFIYMLILYICAICVEVVLLRYSKVFVQLSFENQRNTVTYVLNAFWTSVALVLQLIALPMLGQRYTSERVGEIRVALMVISGLYVFELAYRKQMRRPLLIYHFSALFSIIFLQVMLQVSMHIEIICAGLLWLFQATTEQSIFIGLLLYRLKYPKRIVQSVLKFAAVQSFICKMGFLVWLLMWWGLKLAKYHRDFDIALSVMLVLTCAVLMATQIQGSYVVWAIARNMSRERQRPAVLQESPVDMDKTFLLKRESGSSSMWSHSRRDSEWSLASDMSKPRDTAVNVQV
ncbi:hypothetical protein EDD18DRAFT_1351607 [Armillaria luteobubalina]|uniref:Uncharacterized protein n=1 Tax=Armillaria luteobubalina TaxID=153913 RepID=A0AA39Q7P2_9AGAR|nr:hypothetical protein EDD18DRAFT_1351607 [Armillaria luteobubalina]